MIKTDRINPLKCYGVTVANGMMGVVSSPKPFKIKNVVAADEWAENVDNNAFTNAAAKVNLQNAASAAKISGIKADADRALVA